MAKKISQWLTKMEACQPTIDRSGQVDNDQEYYDGYIEPSHILWAMGCRQSNLTAQVLNEMALDMVNVDSALRPLLDAALGEDGVEELEKCLSAAKVLASDSSRRDQRYAARITVRLLELALGDVELNVAAAEIGEHFHRNNRIGGNRDARAEFMNWLREKFPYKVWSKGL